jgi:hypothetical protein
VPRAGGVGAGEPHDLHRIADRRERISQLVRERGQKLVLAPVSLFSLPKIAARLVLALARPQCRAHGACERREADRPVEQSHVAQQLDQPCSRRRIRAAAGEQQYGKVRPGLLAADHFRQQRATAGRDRFLGNQHCARAELERASQLERLGAGHALEPGLAEHVARELRVPTGRRQDEHALLQALAPDVVHLDFFCGTPVSTPW